MTATAKRKRLAAIRAILRTGPISAHPDPVGYVLGLAIEATDLAESMRTEARRAA